MTNLRWLLCALLLPGVACGRTDETPTSPSAVPSSTALSASPGSVAYATAGGLRFAGAAGWQEVPDGQRRRDTPQLDGTTSTMHSNWFYRGSPDTPDTLLNFGVSD